MFGGIGGIEIFIIFLAILVVLGPKKIPEVAQTLAKGLRAFRNATDDIKQEVMSASEEIKAPLKNIEKDISNPLKDKSKENKEEGKEKNYKDYLSPDVKWGDNEGSISRD